MKLRSLPVAVLVFVVTAVMFSSCATSNLQYYDFDGESMRIRVSIAPDARVEANYHVNIDPDDPIGTIVSIGTSVAKASQVEQAQEKMDAATRDLDIRAIIEDELSAYYEDVFDMRIVQSSSRSTYELAVEITEYGIDASGSGSSVEFVLGGQARLYDGMQHDRIWRDRFSARTPIGPAVFGLPGSAGNVLSAAMLADLTEEEIAVGLEDVTRDAAWDVASEFERDFYRSRR